MFRFYVYNMQNFHCGLENCISNEFKEDLILVAKLILILPSL